MKNSSKIGADIEKWAEIIAKYLKPGGLFFIAEFHPFAMVFDEEHPNELRYKYSYFDDQPLYFASEYTYTDQDKMIENVDAYEWQHSFSSILNSLIKQRLTILDVKEYPFTTFQQFSFVEKCKDGLWRIKDNKYEIPLMFSIKAKK